MCRRGRRIAAATTVACRLQLTRGGGQKLISIEGIVESSCKLSRLIICLVKSTGSAVGKVVGIVGELLMGGLMVKIALKATTLTCGGATVLMQWLLRCILIVMWIIIE